MAAARKSAKPCRTGKKSRFVDGLRYTDNDTMDVVEMVLGGLVNSQIVRQINNEGGRAVGISGKDGNLLQARRLKIKKSKGDVDLGLVGQVEKIDGKVVALLDKADFIPVIAPIGVDEKGDTLNINADLVAAALAVELSAKALFLLTNTAGVLDGRGKLIAELRAAKARKLLKDGVIQGGMQPKVQWRAASGEQRHIFLSHHKRFAPPFIVAGNFHRRRLWHSHFSINRFRKAL